MSTLATDLVAVEIAHRAGLSVPALITSMRSAGNQRRYPRSALRRLAFIAAAQRSA